MSSQKIVVVGSSNTDLIIRVPHLPAPGETILGGKFLTAPGGKGANQAVAAARAGGTVALVAKVGDDHYGREAVAGFMRDGIDVAHVFRDRRAPSGVALIFVSARGENCIAVADSANARLSPADVKRAAVALVEGQPLPAAVRFAHAAAALSVTRPGAQSSAPQRRAVDKLLNSGV